MLMLHLHYFGMCPGAALYTRYPQNVTEFLAKLEAFLMNTHHSTLTLELMGQFEQVLYKDSQNVSDFTISLSKAITTVFKTTILSYYTQAKAKPVQIKKEVKQEIKVRNYFKT